MSDQFRQRRDAFEKRFETQRRSIERTGRLVRIGAIAVMVASIPLAGVVIYVAWHFIAKFW